MKSSIFDTYTSYVIPHGCHIHKTETDTDMEKCVLFVSFHMINMRCLTGKVCSVVVLNVTVFLYPIKNQKYVKQTRVQQYILVSID